MEAIAKTLPTILELGKESEVKNYITEELTKELLNHYQQSDYLMSCEDGEQNTCQATINFLMNLYPKQE